MIFALLPPPPTPTSSPDINTVQVIGVVILTLGIIVLGTLAVRPFLVKPRRLLTEGGGDDGLPSGGMRIDPIESDVAPIIPFPRTLPKRTDPAEALVSRQEAIAERLSRVTTANRRRKLGDRQPAPPPVLLRPATPGTPLEIDSVVPRPQREPGLLIPINGDIFLEPPDSEALISTLGEVHDASLDQGPRLEPELELGVVSEKAGEPELELVQEAEDASFSLFDDFDPVPAVAVAHQLVAEPELLPAESTFDAPAEPDLTELDLDPIGEVDGVVEDEETGIEPSLFADFLESPVVTAPDEELEALNELFGHRDDELVDEVHTDELRFDRVEQLRDESIEEASATWPEVADFLLEQRTVDSKPGASADHDDEDILVGPLSRVVEGQRDQESGLSEPAEPASWEDVVLEMLSVQTEPAAVRSEPPAKNPNEQAEALVASLIQTIRQLIYCANAGQLLSGFALYTDAYLFRFMDETGLSDEEFREAFEAIPAKPTEEWSRLSDLRDFVRHDDGRVSVTASYVDRGGHSVNGEERYTFVLDEDRHAWMIDDIEMIG